MGPPCPDGVVRPIIQHFLCWDLGSNPSQGIYFPKMKKQLKKKINVKVLIFSLLITYFVGFIGSIFTSKNTKSEWYNSIRPSITPPNIVFPIVWNILFFLIGLSLAYSWLKAKSKIKTAVFYGINFALNIIWSVFYFAMKNPLLAFFDIILLIASTLYLIIYNWKIDRKASYLLMPYLLWLLFASILNFLSIR